MLAQDLCDAGLQQVEVRVEVDAYGPRPVPHTLEQVRRYVSFLTEFTRALEREPDSVVGAAYLHNADDRDMAGLRLVPESEHVRLFTKSGRGAWIGFLQSRLASTSGRLSADQLLSSRIAPSGIKPWALHTDLSGVSGTVRLTLQVVMRCCLGIVGLRRRVWT